MAGIVAGLTTKTNKLGFIAAKPIPQVLRNINSYTLGARSVNPKATTTVIFTGDWSMPVKEAEAANSLIDQGVDVLTMHVDSPEGDRRDRRAARRLRHRLPRQPGGAGAQGLPDRRRVELGQGLHATTSTWVQAGKTYPHLLRGGLKEGFVKVSPYGKAVSGGDQEEGRRGQGQVHGRHDGHLQGPAQGQHRQGRHPGRHRAEADRLALEKMDYLVEGVVGKTH